MAKKYKRRTEKAKWTKQQLEAAAKAVGNGRPVREVGRSFNIPESTLRDRIKARNFENAKLGRNPVFSEDQERALVKHITKLANIFYGITPLELRRLSYKFAVKNNIKHTFDHEKKLAGEDWLKLFLRRNSTISLRKPEGTSLNRVSAFNKIEVETFFENVTKVLEKYKFPESRIFNVDETGISTVQKPSKILASKGQKQVGYAISWERGKTVTVTCAMSALGQYVPPMFIFPRQRMNLQLQKDGPIGAAYKCSKNGWTNDVLFLEWIEHFNKHVKASLEDPVLLILDNHSSHTSLDVYNFCKSNGIIMVSLAPHTSHKMQPLDLTFFGPLKNAFNRECDLHLKNHAYEKITHYDLASIFNKAYIKVATMEKGISGFRAAGIWPLNPDTFSEDDFCPLPDSSMPIIQTEIDLNETENDSAIQDRDVISEKTLQVAKTQSKTPDKTQHEADPYIDPQPGPSRKSIVTQASPLRRQLEELNPIPKPVLRTAIRGTKKHSEILTSTPLKEHLEAAKKKRELKELKKAEKIKQKENIDSRQLKKRKTKKINSKTVKKPRHVRNLHLDDTDSNSSISCDENMICDDDELDDVDPTNTDICIICGEFGQDGELWYRCVKCSYWSHAACSGWDTAKDYTCDMCISKE